ncbi:response regulator transcription factor [soil metagenome]
MQKTADTKIVLVDDHKLFRKGIVELVNGFPGYTVAWEANNGKEFTEALPKGPLPDIVLLDITMPEMDGYETAAWLREHYPDLKVLALSMYDQEEAIIKMLTLGARGYILKDADPAELETAFHELMDSGFYHSPLVSGALVHNFRKGLGNGGKKGGPVHLNERETEFLKLASTELTYKEIADRMCLATRTIDGYREALFEKLQVKSRTGLVLYAIRTGIVKV